MITFQDFETASLAGGLPAFIRESIAEFKGSQFYANAIEGKKYYEGKNTAIMSRLNWLYDGNGAKRKDNFKANNRIANEFFTKIIKQENSYLLANGLTTEEKIKEGLGRKFDVKLQLAGIDALVDGVSWGYCNINEKKDFNVDVWCGTEFLPLQDERTGVLKAGIRFWQLEPTRPMWIELYEESGMSEYKIDGTKIEMTKGKRGYLVKKQSDIIDGEVIVEESNFSKLPIFPLYANDTKESEFTWALKSKIDLYDIIMSDFGNNLEDSNDLYWVIKNYQGQEMDEFLAEFKSWKMMVLDGEGDASPHTVEVPYQARKEALAELKEQIFEGAMAVDIRAIGGGSLTNVAIQSAFTDLDLKTDAFEWQVIDFCENIIDLYLEYTNQTIDYQVDFIRRGIINDTEIIENLNASADRISQKTYLKKHPYIDNEDEELDELDIESRSKFVITDGEEV